jgi:RNA polymerase sigma factor (sigma-70 family)
MGTEDFDALFDRYYGRLVKYVKYKNHRFSVEDARDVAQEAFIKSMKHLPEIVEAAQWSYLKRAAHSTAYNATHRGDPAMRDEVRNDDPLLLDDAPCERMPIDELLARRQESAAIHKRIAQALRALPEVSRLCLLGRMRGVSYEKLCDDLNLKPGTARSHVNRATAQLREEIGTAPDWFVWEDGHDE